MIKSLEKLREGYFSEYPCYENTHPQFQHDRAEQLADEIQAEIDKFYLPRPLFEDGEPVQFGDYINAVPHGRPDNRLRFERIIYYNSGIVRLDIAGFAGRILQIGERMERPEEPDTQAKIDEDSILTALEYCEKYGIECDEVVRGFEKCRHLLARQRKLDGVE